MRVSCILFRWWTVLTLMWYLIRPLHCCLELSESNLPVLFCQSSVSHLPLSTESIPAQLAKVRILGIKSSDNLHDGRLSQINLTGLETLTYLEISNFNLVHIHADSFRAMRQLRVLDLSRNHIRSIHPGAFSGLILDLLSLTDNPGITFPRGVFRGSRIDTLVARDCVLRELDYVTIAEAKPKRLSLSHNQITSLDQRFENLIKPWVLTTALSPADMDEWGFIDLTNNPLSCNCQLVWLSRVIEEQLYLSQRTLTKRGKTNEQVRVLAGSDSSQELPAKRMFQLNLTCGSPPHLAGKVAPHSRNFFCPKPRVVGIDISLLTNHADHAQLTCIGQGQPPPGLAWTYRINGHKVQKTLDPSIHKHHISPEYFPYQSPSHHSESALIGYPETHVLHARSIALNISLREPSAKNFTCTVWNDDSPNIPGENYPFDMIDRLKSNGLHVPNKELLESLPNYRMHEVTVRIRGPPRLTGESFNSLDLSQERREALQTDNHTENDPSIASTDTELVSTTRTYEYLFTERFSLLQLLGAVFGTFIVTLALLYSLTHFLSCFCQFPQFPLKELQRTHPNEKRKTRWLSISKSRGAALLGSGQRIELPTQCTPERAPLNDTTLSRTLNCDSAFSLLTSSTNGHTSTPGPSTVSLRKQTVPQALLLTGVPIPPVDRDSTTPPLNPAYWPMPEYTYTGTGSHEYDVPRPLEPLITSRSLVRSRLTDSHINTAGVTQSFINLSHPPVLPGFAHLQYPDSRISRNPMVLPPPATLSPLNAQWPQTMNGSNSIFNTLFPWNHLGINGTDTVPPNSPNRHLPCMSYPQYPSSHSIVYTDYPAYLQTRPYPHHQNPAQPLLELMTQSSQMSLLQKNPSIDNQGDRTSSFKQPQDSTQLNGHTTGTTSSTSDAPTK